MAKRLTHEKVRELICKKYSGSELLNNKIYKNASSKINIKCENNHVFETCWNKIQQKRWCPTCWKNKHNLNIKDVAGFLQQHHPGSIFLEKEYINNSTKMLIQCDKGHQWKVHFGNLKNGKWCPVCRKTAKPTIEQIQKLVKEKHGGKCLETNFVKSITKMKFQCKCENIFFLSWHAIRLGSWCPLCRIRVRPTIEYINKFVREKHGTQAKCLEIKYVNCEHPMLFQCEKGHQWVTQWNYVKNGNNWCPECNAYKQPTIALINDFVKRYNGKCLSEKYKNNREKLLFECHNGHQWDTHWKTINSGTWCPSCAESFGESMTRFIFEEMFHYKFKKIRPSWLIYKTGRKLELDGYCKELNIAFEYQGRQHNEIVKEFKGTNETLQQQKERDKYKKKYCELNNIQLITIKQFNKKFRPIDLIKYLNIKFPNQVVYPDMDISKYYK
jgi:hypothetical protein